MLDRIEFLMGEAMTSFFRNFLMTIAAITTSAVSLFLLGGVGYVYYQANQAAENFSKSFEMRVFLKDGIAKDAIHAAAEEMRTINGVAKVTWIPKDVPWKKLQQEDPGLVVGLDNPYPDAFKVQLTDVKLADSVAKDIAGFSFVEKDGVVYQEDLQKLMENTVGGVRTVGGGVGLILLLTAGVLIYNAVRLTVISRRREIRIMQLVGATQFTVRTPFVLEGVMHGILGGFIAAVLILVAQLVLQMNLDAAWGGASSLPAFPLINMVLLLGTIGALFGALCSYIAVREPLRYRSGVQV